MSNTTRATRFILSMAALSTSMFGAMNIAQAAEVNNNLHQGQGQGQSPAVHAPATAQPQPAAPSKPAPAPDHKPAPAPAAHPGQGQPAAPSKPAPQPAPAPQPTPAQTQGQGQGQSQAQQTQVQLGQQTGVVTEVDTKTTVQTGVDVNAVGQGGKGGNAQGGAASQGQSSVNENSSGASSAGNTTTVDASNRSKTTYYNPGATILPSNTFNGGQTSTFSYSGNVCNANIASMSLSEGVQHEKSRGFGINSIFGGFAVNSADSEYGLADEFKPVARSLPVWTSLQTGATLNPYMENNGGATASQLLYMASIHTPEPSAKDQAIVHGLGSIKYKQIDCGQSTPPVVVTPPDHGGTTGVPQGQEGKDNNG
jgi:hypothetical protein